MSVVAFAPVSTGSGFRPDNVPESTTEFGMQHSALRPVQAEPNACDVSSIRSTRPRVVTTNNRDQEV